MHRHNHKLAVSQAYTNIVQAYRHTGLIQTHKLIATQAAKLPTCHYTGVTQKLQACRHTGNRSKSLLPHSLEQNYKLTATRAKNYKPAATQLQAKKLPAFRHTGPGEGGGGVIPYKGLIFGRWFCFEEYTARCFRV